MQNVAAKIEQQTRARRMRNCPAGHVLHYLNTCMEGLQHGLPGNLANDTHERETFLGTASQKPLSLVIDCDHLFAFQAGTKLTEGINAILASGVIQGEGGRFSAIEDAAMEPALPLSIAYFNALTGTWETIRNESDW